MKSSTCATRILARTIALCLFLPGGVAFADERPLIWSPSKIAGNSYGVRMGVRLQQTGSASASLGAEVAVKASESGKIGKHGTPVQIWATVASSRGTGTARSSTREVNFRLDAVNGSGNAAVASLHTWIVTPSLDLESNRSVSLGCNGYKSRCRDFRLSQTARLVASGSGTALVAQAGVAGRGAGVHGRVGIEQKIWGAIDFGVSVANPDRAAVGSVTAKYALNW
ncbi:hypothetical protein DEM27_16090 [Metarhizobium album]|uniref:Uncharacterized protein n=1 Tax=Metarhizobium album TaxID=2182425 RepID=A0A2U2DQI3_9HYPH|nr:hypothetical protein [Rhizobium album]PWE55568.1 hypothetical protein DEM27_16090 [Rhizobium album]